MRELSGASRAVWRVRLQRAAVAVAAAALVAVVASASAAAPSSRRCTAQQLKGRSVTSEVGAGRVDAEFALVNDGSAACSLFGYPHLQMVSASGDPIATDDHNQAAGLQGVVKKLVTLAKGKSAYFGAGYEDGTGFTQKCPSSSWLLVIPPQVVGADAVTGAGAQIGPYGGATLKSCGEVDLTPVTTKRITDL